MVISSCVINLSVDKPRVIREIAQVTRAEFETALVDAGLTEIEIRETYRVHEHARIGDCPRAQASVLSNRWQ